MRYCFLTYGPWEGNAAQIRPRGLGTALLDLGVDVAYIVDDFQYNRTSLGLDPRAVVRYVAHPRGPRQIAGRRRELRELDPDVVHVLNPHAKTLAAIAGKPRLRVVAEWDEPPTLRPLRPARLALERWLDRWLRRRADHIVVCSRGLQRRFADLYGLDVPYIPHATYLDVEPDGPSPFDRPTAVYLGTFSPAWDHDLIFEAARLLAAKGECPEITFVGIGAELARWKAFAREHALRGVRFTGWLGERELWRHLRHAHVALFPIRDTVLNRCRCPSKLFAYAQARRPIVTNSVGEVPELLGDLPIFIDETPEAFANAIGRLMRAPRDADVDYGAERHTYADRAARLLEVIGTDSGR